MGSQRPYLPNSATLSTDRAVLRALQNTPDYAPHNPAYSTIVLSDSEALLTQAEIEMERARHAFNAARERLLAAAWIFHNGISGAKDAFVGQFGADSPNVLVIGLKKKSDRKRIARRRTAAP